ncbi:acyl-CoA thioesterase [Virgibacillus soli]|uniref:Thioesterase family protein n=1 Tax=Paracerasibacillus soli TaxID=480284 RepID=A0ABU5CQV8_9BACI|nr:thioesterase family protein [Virgibacillus soli]MDY0408605.1 thioesterase family protein [Virgibacillus soli]
MKNISYIEDYTKWKADFKFCIPINVRFSETDMFGHVNNVSPFIYFEEARIAYMKEIGLFSLDDQPEGIPVVADLQCDYHRQMYFQNQLQLFVKTNTVGKTSFDIHYMAVNEKEELCLTGRGRIVYVNPSTGKPVQLDDEMIQRLLDN